MKRRSQINLTDTLRLPLAQNARRGVNHHAPTVRRVQGSDITPSGCLRFTIQPIASSARHRCGD